MPAQFTLPPDTRAVGSGNPPADINAVVDALTATGAVGNVLNAAYAGGADPTGGADSTAAFAAAIAALPAGGGTIRVPAGTYKCNTAQLVVATGLHLVGDGYDSTTINCTAGGTYLFNLDPPGYSTTVHVEDLLITGLTINATGMDIFWGANIVRSRIISNQLIQNSNGNAVMNVSQSTGTNGVTYIAECEFANKEMIGGAARTIEAWHLDHSGTGMRCNDNVWHGGGNKIWPANSGDTSHYWMLLLGSAVGSQGSKHNTWRDLVFECPSGVGGLVYCQSVASPTFEKVSLEDLASATVGLALFRFGSVTGGTDGCRGVTFRNYVRRGGTGISNSLPDIKFDVNCTEVYLDSPQENGGGTALTIDYGSCAGPVTEIAPSPGTVRLNVPTVGAYQALYPAAYADPAGPVPSDAGFVGWAYDPAELSVGTGNLLTAAGTLFCIKVPVRAAQPVSNIYMVLITAGATLTASQNFAGLYSSSGSLLATTADQSANWVGATGDLVMALTGAPFTVTPPYVYVALVFNGTTSPTFWGNTGRSNQQASGVGAALRYRLANTAQTTLPATLSGSSGTTRQIWCAIY